MIQIEFITAVIEKARNNDYSAQEQLIQMYQKRIAGFVYAMVGSSMELEDIAQNIFIKMIMSLKGLKEYGQFEPWLFRIARNVCMDHLRKKKLRGIFTALLPIHSEIAESDNSLSDEALWIKKVLQDLPAKQRELLVLMQDREYTYEELSKITGSTVSSVKSLLFRARETLSGRRDRELGKRGNAESGGEGIPAVTV